MARRMRAWIAATSGVALASSVALAAVTLSPVAHATVQPAGTANPSSRVVTLVTGEQIRLTDAGDGHVAAALATPDGQSGHYTTMGTPAAQYVIPEQAQPFLGRQLDMSLFNVTSPPAGVEVSWEAGASRHAIPGLSVDSGQIESAADFGAALRTSPAEALAGVASIRAAGPIEAKPHFPLGTLIVKGVDRTGKPVVGGSVSVVNLDDTKRFISLAAFYEGAVAFSVPVGRYTLTTNIITPGESRTDSIVVLPEVTVSGSQTVVTMDARKATAPVTVPTTPEPSKIDQFSSTLGRVSVSGEQVTLSEGYIGYLPTLFITPVSAVKTGKLHWYSYFRLRGTSGSTLYDVEFPYDNKIPAEQPTEVDPATLAKLEAEYRSEVPGVPIAPYRPGFLPWETFSFRPVSQATAPLRRTEYVTARPDLAWANTVIWRGDENNATDEAPRQIYRPGQQATDVYLAAPLVPGAISGTVVAEPCTICRQGDNLAMNIAPWSDGTHSIRAMTAGTTLTVKSSTELFSGGKLVGRTDLPTGTVPIPAGASDLRMVVTTDKTAEWTTTSTHTSTAWTWHSKARSGTLPKLRTCPDGGQKCVLEPLLFLAYELGADISNAIPADQEKTVRVRAYHQMYDTAPAATKLTLDVSTDDGTTWKPVKTKASGDGVFTATLPAAADGFLSLRGHAEDAQGNAIDQTVIHAVRVVTQ